MLTLLLILALGDTSQAACVQKCKPATVAAHGPGVCRCSEPPPPPDPPKKDPKK